MAIYKKILLAIDGSQASSQAMAKIASFATPGAAVRIVHVLEDPLTIYPMINEDFTYIELLREVNMAEGKKLLAQAEAALRAQGYAVQTSLPDLRELGGDIPAALKAEGEAWDADLAVLGSHGRRGVRRMLLGSVAEHFVRISERPVLLVHPIEQAAGRLGHEPPAAPEQTGMLKRILVAVDGSELAQSALRQASALAKEHGCEIRALYVNVDPFLAFPLLGVVYFQREPMLQAAAEQAANIRKAALDVFDTFGIRGDVQILDLETRDKRVADLIREVGKRWNASAVVMGSHGLQGMQRLMLGSVAEHYLCIADRPVLIVKS